MGKLHGGGYKIKNMRIYLPDVEYVGLFKFIVHPRVDSLGIENCDVTGGERETGALAGRILAFDYSIKNYISNC
jgi:hypothetical protein